MPSIVPNFEYDVFISYRHNDNLDGWVNDFVQNLEKELRGTLKDSLTIYFDKNPHDGLQQHHEVDDSLKEKLKSLILIPIISQTYCDPKAFAWAHELIPFIQQASEDTLGLKTRVSGGNIASRILPVQIHDIDNRDKQLFEEATGSAMRTIDFIYKESGVNRPLRASDDRTQNQQHTDYRNQVNKVANAIKEIISGLQNEPGNTAQPESNRDSATTTAKPRKMERAPAFRLPTIRTVTAYKLLSIISLAAFIAMAVVHFSTQDSDVQTYVATILPPEHTNFTNYQGGHISLSPDGRLLAFVATDTTGKDYLWVRPLNSKTARVLAGTEGAKSPFWSPDSKSIGFFAEGKLKKIESVGGTPTVLCNAQSGRGGSWNPDGEIIFCPTIYPSPLFRVSASGGTPVVLTKLDSTAGHSSHRWPTFLPDGKHFLYCARTATGLEGNNDALYLGSLDSTFVPRVIARAGSSVSYANGYIFFTIEATLMAQPFDAKGLVTTGSPVIMADKVYYELISAKANYSVSENGILIYGTADGQKQSRLVWYNRNGQVTNGGTIGGLQIQLTDFQISPDKSRLAGTMTDTKTNAADIWIYNFVRGVSTRFTFDKGWENWPIWSPDGSIIVYSSRGTKGRVDLYKKSSNGESGEVLLRQGQDKFGTHPTDWSRDGRFILYSGGGDVWVLPMERNSPAEPYRFLQTAFFESNAVFSPDGKWVAYQSNESGRSEIYIQPFPGPGGKWQVSTNGGNRPRWSDDGKELFYIQPPGGIYAVAVTTQAASIEIGKARQLFLVNTTLDVNNQYDVMNNGQLFLVRSAGAPISTPLTLVVNWPEVLKKK